MAAALHLSPRRGAASLALLMLPAAAWAHGGLFTGANAPAALWLIQGVYVLAWFAYALGAALRRPTPWRRAGFHLAMLLAGLALFGPLDDLAVGSTAWHMLQHMLLMVVVAPLLVMARPGPQWRACLGPGRAAPAAAGAWPGQRAGRAALMALLALARRLLLPLGRGLARASRHPMPCALLHALAVWAWHAPPLYMAAVMNTSLHVLEHISFLFTGVLFWWAVLQPGRHRVPQAALALLFTLMHTGLLGAVLTFAREPLYGSESRELWDQQLAGLLMWVPGGMVYLLACAWAAFRWLGTGPAVRPAARPAGL